MVLGDEMGLFSGRASSRLGQDMAEYLGIHLGNIEVKSFSDMEVYVKINENVRGKDIFLIQSTCPPVNENLMELLIMIDAFKRASAKNITAVIPYYAYARQDRKTSGRECPSGR